MRTLQEIFDFCHSDATYRAYYDIPAPFRCDQHQYRYFHGCLSNGRSRGGSFIFRQSRIQLERFLGSDRTDFYFHINPSSGQIVDRQRHKGPAVYVVVHIGGYGVDISLSHPFNGPFDNAGNVFRARSHRPFTVEGLRDEAVAYLRKHILFAPGYYYELQMRYRISKTDFIPWYRNYQAKQHQIAEEQHQDMLEKYRRITYGDARRILVASGIFEDFNCDEAERDQLTDDFVQHYNQ